jgi:hypothetical protein
MNEKELEEQLNDKWTIAEVVKNAINSAHTSPSPITLEIIKDIKEHLQEQKDDIKEIKKDTKDTLVQAIKTNGRVNALEKVNAENQPTISSYKKDKVRVVTAGAIIFALGATIIGLSILAIDSKIERGVEKALSKYDIEYKPYEER